MNTRWQIQLFGGLQALQDQHSVRKFRTHKAAALLARLAFFPHRVHPREELIDQLWPDAEYTAGRNNFKQILSSLRRQLEPPGTPFGGVLAADRFGVRLNPEAVQTDVAAFEAAVRAAHTSADPQTQLAHLVKALELYAGELLPGFYDDWVLTERERLACAHEQAGERCRLLQAGLAPPAPVFPPLPAPPVPARAPLLPPLFTRFFGRAVETEQLQGWLTQGDVRLVTLTGPGGIGKTRLSIEVAARAAMARRGLVCFVPLADLYEPLLIGSAIAAALRLPRTVQEASLDSVVAALSEEEDVLLVLDNLEQIAEEVASPILTLLTRVPRLQILAVSRQRLYVPGEREFPVAPLPVSAAGATPEQMSGLPGVQLFVDRAQLARADFQITARNAEAVASICRQVDGLPLALELAAAWIQVLSPRQITERLQERSDLLVNRRKETSGRHRSVWAAISWSHDLLSPELRRFWTRLAVFRGGWTASAAQDVCEETSALSLLTQLQARSLVLAEDDGLEIRFRMLETLREFAWAQQTSEERSETARRHTDFFRRLAKQAQPELVGPGQTEWLPRLDAEDANLRAALTWALTNDGLAALDALEMCDSLWRFWDIRGRYRESAAAHEAALQAAPDAPLALRQKVLAGAGSHSLSQGDALAARRFHELSLSLCRQSGSAHGVSAALHNLAMISQRAGDLDRARALFQESCDISRTHGDHQGYALSLNSLGRVAFAGGDYAAARALYQESLAIKRTSGDRLSIANTLGNLGTVAQREGDHAAAEDYYRQCLTLHAEIGDRTGIALTLINLGDAARRRSDWSRTTSLVAAAHAIQEGLLSVLSASDRGEVEAIIAEAEASLGRKAFAAAWATGTALTLEDAIVFSLG